MTKMSAARIKNERSGKEIINFYINVSWDHIQHINKNYWKNINYRVFYCVKIPTNS